MAPALRGRTRCSSKSISWEAEAALQRLREIMGKLKLTVNEEKTRICKVPEDEFDFLGYTFGRMYSARTGKASPPRKRGSDPDFLPQRPR